MADKCRKTVGLFLGTTLEKIRFNGKELDNQSGGQKPMAWNIQSLKEHIYTDIFLGNDVTKRNASIKEANKAMKHTKLLAKVKTYLKSATATKPGEELNKMIVDLTTKREDGVTDKEHAENQLINGTTIRARGIAFNQIIKTIEAEYNIQRNMKLEYDENQLLTETLTHEGSRVLAAVSLYAAIGRQISIATGYKAATDSVMTDKQFYNLLGQQAVESLAKTGVIKILDNVHVINNGLLDVNEKDLSSDATVKGTGIVVDLGVFSDKDYGEKDFKKTDKFKKKRTMLAEMLERGFTNNKKMKDYQAFDTTFAASQIINTYTTPVNLVAPRSVLVWESIKKNDDYKDQWSMFRTMGLGTKYDGKLKHGVPNEVVKLFEDERYGLNKRNSQVNPVVDDIFLSLNEILVEALDKESGAGTETTTLKKAFYKIGLTDPKDQAAVFGVFYDSVPDQIESNIGQAISKENPLVNLILNYNAYAGLDKNGDKTKTGNRNYVNGHIMYKTTRVTQESTILNEQAGKFFDRPMVSGGEYNVKRDSGAFITIIESLVDEFMVDKVAKKKSEKASAEKYNLRNREMIENQGVSPELDALVQGYERVFLNKHADMATRVKEQIKFIAQIGTGKIRIEDNGKGKIVDIPFKFSSPWEGIDMLGAVSSIRRSTGSEVRLRYRTKPDATASGVVLTLLQALGASEKSDKAIIVMLKKLQIAQENGDTELALEEIFNDAYDVVEKAVEEEHLNMSADSTKTSTQALVEEFTEAGIFKAMRDIIKPITMLTNYEAGKETAVLGASQEFSDMLIKYMLHGISGKTDEQRRKALEKIHEMIEIADPGFFKANKIEEFNLSGKRNANPEMELANLVGIRDVFIKYFSREDGIASRLRDLQDAEFTDTTHAYKAKTKYLYDMISDLKKADIAQFGAGSKNVNMHILPAVTWHYVSNPKIVNGIVTNKDHWDYSEDKKGNAIGKAGDVVRGSKESGDAYRAWYQEAIKQYGMPITSRKQMILGAENGDSDIDNNALLILKEVDNQLTAIVNPIHSLDAAILLVSHEDTVNEIKELILKNEGTVYGEVLKQELMMASGMIHDANNASAIYNEIYQKYYRQNSINLNLEYDIQDQLSMLYDSYQAVDGIMKFEDGTVIYQSDKNAEMDAYVKEKTKKKSEIINKIIVQNESMYTNPKLFGFNTTNMDGSTKSYLRKENKNDNTGSNEDIIDETTDETNTQEPVNTGTEGNVAWKEKFGAILNSDKPFPTGKSDNEFGKLDEAFFKGHSEELIKKIKNGNPFVMLDSEYTFTKDRKLDKKYYAPGKDGADSEILQMHAKVVRYDKESGKIVPVKDEKDKRRNKKVDFKFYPTNPKSYNEQIDEGDGYFKADYFKEGKNDYTNEKAEGALLDMLEYLGKGSDEKMPIVAYNGARADFEVMSQFEEVGKKLSENFEPYDAAVLSNWTLRNNSTNEREGSTKKKIWGRKQGEVAEMLGLDDNGKAHDAEYDTNVMGEILEAITKRGLNIKETEKVVPKKKAKKKAKKSKAEYQKKSNVPFSSDTLRLREIINNLKEMYPKINIEYVEKLVDESGIEVIGSALGNTVSINIDKAGADTIPHEYAHVYINILENESFMKNILKKIHQEKGFKVNDVDDPYSKAKEYLANKIGIVYANRKTVNISEKEQTLIHRIWSFIKSFFNKTEADKLRNRKLMEEGILEVALDFKTGKNKDLINTGSDLYQSFINMKEKEKSGPITIDPNEMSYNSSKELQKVGTQKEYVEYLKTIFPNSSVQDILAHDTGSAYSRDDRRNLKDSWMYDTDVYVDGLGGNYGLVSGEGFYMYKPNGNAWDEYASTTGFMKLNTNKPLNSNSEEYKKIKGNNYYQKMSTLTNTDLQHNPDEDYMFDGTPEPVTINSIVNKQTGHDSFINEVRSGLTEYVAWSGDQVHILASKKDISSFKSWKNKNTKNQRDTGNTGSGKVDTKLEKKIREVLQTLYPKIELEYTVNGIDGTVDIKGQANIRAQTVLINSLLQSQDTLPHEYAHHYIAMFRSSPIVKKAIEKWGTEEKLVQAIGEQAVKQKGEAYGWWKKFENWIKELFDSLDSKSKEELRDLLTDSFLTNQDLDTNLDVSEEHRVDKKVDERYIEHAYSRNALISEIGTEKEYTDYLNTVFPNSVDVNLFSHKTYADGQYSAQLKIVAANYLLNNKKLEKDSKNNKELESALKLLARRIDRDIPISDSLAVGTRTGELRRNISGNGTGIVFGKEYTFVPLTDAEWKNIQKEAKELDKNSRNKRWYNNQKFSKSEFGTGDGNAIFGEGFYFSREYDGSVGYRGLEQKEDDTIITKLDVKNPYYNRTTNKYGIDREGMSQDIQNDGYDAFYQTNRVTPNTNVEIVNQAVVYEPEQIHVLGSDKDIEMFQEWQDKQVKSPNVQNQKTDDTQHKNGEPKKAPKKRAPEDLKTKLKYELDRKNHHVDLDNPLDVMLYNLNTTITRSVSDVVDTNLSPLATGVSKMAHDWMYDNSDIYKMQYDRTTKYWDSAIWLQSMKGYLNSWGRFKNWDDMNAMITESDQAAQRRKHIEDTKISEIDAQMRHLSKNQQENIFEVMSLSPVFWLVGEDAVLSELMKLKGNDVTTAIDKWIEVYKGRIDSPGKVKRIQDLAGVITYAEQPVTGSTIYNIEALHPQSDIERSNMGALLALEAIKKNVKVDENGVVTRSYEEVFDLLSKNPELSKNLINISVATKQSFDEVYGMTGDERLYRDNLLFEQFEKPKEFQIATLSELNQNRYPVESGWKTLRKPGAQEYGVVYRDIVEETIQPGAGTSLRYKTADILVPRDKYKDKANNVTIVYPIEGEKKHKITLTKKELTKLGMIRNPGDTLVRAYGRMMEIKDTQAARDEITNQTMTFYVNGEAGLQTLDDSLETMDVQDRPVFLNLPEGVIYKEVLEKYENIGTHYKVVENVTSIGGLNDTIHLVRKDASDMIIGYKDPVLFQDNEFLRKSAYTLRQMVKMTKIHWAIVNVGKIIGDTTSNIAILAAYGVPMVDMPKMAGKALTDLKRLEELRIQLLDAEFEKHTEKNTGKNVDAKIKAIKKKIKNQPMAVLLNNGLLQSLSLEILNKDESVISGLQNDIEGLFNKFLKDKDGNNNNFSKAIKGLSQMGWNIEDLLKFAGKGAKQFEVLESFGKGLDTTAGRIHANKENGDMAKYLSEFIASPDSTAVRLGSALVMTIDIASRKILLDTLLSRGVPEQEALQIVSEAFVDYKINMPKELKVISDYGVLLFPSFWMRIQKVIYSTLKANPAGAAVGIGLQNALDIHMETILDSNMLYKMFGKDLSGNGLSFVNAPPLGLDTFLPTDLFGF